MHLLLFLIFAFQLEVGPCMDPNGFYLTADPPDGGGGTTAAIESVG